MPKNFLVDLLIIDPQQDFCNPKGFDYEGTLYVKGAEKDMDNLATMVKRIGSKLNDIHVTLDSHQAVDIGHPAYWVGRDGKNPAPFTQITLSDVQKGVWHPAILAYQKRVEKYAEAIEKGGRYPMIVWPPHCLIGEQGHNVYPPLAAALREWGEKQIAVVDYVTKGSNPHTEHYSAVRAEVPDPADPTTQLNTELIETLKKVDEILIAGEALSHCVANTVSDIATAFGNDDYVKKFVLLEDCSSKVVTGDKATDKFIDDMTNKFMSDMLKRGMRTAKSTDYLK